MSRYPSPIDHGRKGNIRVKSEWNADREPPSRQVWVYYVYNGRKIASSSANLVSDIGSVDIGCCPLVSLSTVPKSVTGELTKEELEFVDKIAEEFEGRSS